MVGRQNAVRYAGAAGELSDRRGSGAGGLLAPTSAPQKARCQRTRVNIAVPEESHSLALTMDASRTVMIMCSQENVLAKSFRDQIS